MTTTATKTLWAKADLEKALGAEVTTDITGKALSIDTRTLTTGDVYLALKGHALDGHDYVAAAFDAGASAAIVKQDYVAPENVTGVLIRVADTQKALEDLGRFARARFQGKVIGITGSAGKTGTKEMLAAMLGAQAETHASRKSFNNHWGVPLSLANLPPDAAYGIFEMGMNHAGELTALTKMVHPDVVVITTIEPAHIEYFKSVEAIADAKAEIFLGLSDQGVAILPHDNPHYQRLKNHAEAAGVKEILCFGEDGGGDQAQAKMNKCTLFADSSKISATIMGSGIRYTLNIPGKHIAMNALAALMAVQIVDADLSKAIETIETLHPITGRGNRISVPLQDGAPPVMVIDDSYNANPASMQAAFTVLEMTTPQGGQGRRIAVLGDMMELGATGPAQHAGLANPLLKARTDLVFCCGPQMEALFNILPPDWQGGYAPESQSLAKMVIAALQPGDVVLVKGSLSSKMSYVVHAIEHIHDTLKPSETPDTTAKDSAHAV